MCDLKKRYGHRFRIYLEESWGVETGRDVDDKLWYYELRGKYGAIYLYSLKNNLLAVHINSVVISNRVERGHKNIFELYLKLSEGGVFLFDPKNLEFAAKLIKARRRKQISEKERQRLRGLSARFGFKSGGCVYNSQTVGAKHTS